MFTEVRNMNAPVKQKHFTANPGRFMNETPNISIMRKSLFLETITRIREILVTSK